MKQPVFLLAGGKRRAGSRPDPLIRLIMSEITRICHHAPLIAYIGAASEDDAGFFRMMAEAFLRAGAGQVHHLITVPPASDLRKVREGLEQADGIFISGGDVEMGMQVLINKNLSEFLVKLYQNGKLFFGLSAGSIILAREWVRWRNPEDDSTAELFPCLGIAPLICDTHAEEDDWVELKTALELEKSGASGYGIPSGTGLKYSPDGSVEALGGPIIRYANQNGAIIRLQDLRPISPY